MCDTNQQAVKTAEQQKTPIQVEREPVLQEFYRSYQPMDEETLQNYSSMQIQRYQSFKEQYAARMKKSRPGVLPEVQVQALQQAVPQQQPVQPELDEKEERNRLKELEKRRKKGLKLTPGASSYTTTLIAEMENQVISQRASQPYVAARMNTMKENVPADQQEAATRVFGSLLFFAPPITLDKKKNPTPDSVDRHSRFLTQCQQNPREVIAQVKAEMFAKSINPELFTPKYVGEHFQEVRLELDKLKGFTALFRNDTPEFEALTPYEKAQVNFLREISVQGEQAFRSALQANGLNYSEYGLTPMTAEEVENKRNNEVDVAALRESTESLAQRKRQFLEEESERVLAVTAMERAHVFDELRRDMKEEPRTAFINSERLSNAYQYEFIRDTKELIERFPREYEEHKTIVDAMYKDILNQMEGVAVYSTHVQNINAVMFDGEKVRDKEVRRTLDRKMEVYKEKYQNLLNRSAHLNAGLKHILRGSDLTDGDALVLTEYGYEIPAFTARTENACYYATVYNEKQELLQSTVERLYPRNISEENRGIQESILINNGVLGRCMMMMEPGNTVHNEKVVAYMVKTYQVNKQRMENPEDMSLPAAERELSVLAKELALPYLQNIMNYDTHFFERATNEELMASQDTLLNLNLPGMMITDLAKLKDPDQPELSIKDAFLGDKKDLFMMRASVLQGHMMRARALSILEAYKLGNLNNEAFTSAELLKLEDDHEGHTVSEEKLLEYVQNLYIRGVNQLTSGRNRYAQKPENIEKAKAHIKSPAPAAHLVYDAKWDKMKSYQKEKIAETKQIAGDTIADAEICIIEFMKARERVTELTEQLQDITDEEKTMELRAEIDQLQERIDFLEIEYGLTRNHYQLAGEPKELINEPIFRSYDSINGIPAFRSMGEEEFYDMCHKLAAGTIRECSYTLEEIESNRQKNREGLLMYKERMAIHYRGLEEKYHHTIPPIEYIISHLEEVEAEFGNVQVDANLVNHSKDMIDMDNPEDRMIYHLVNFYNGVAGAILNIRFVSIIMGFYDEDFVKKQVEEFMKPSKDSYEYLCRNGVA